jgi:hypothetical protein
MIALKDLERAALVTSQIRFWQPNDSVELRRRLRLRNWQTRMLIQLPEPTMLRALYLFRPIEAYKVLLEFRLTDVGIKQRFEERQAQPFGRAETEGA